VGADSLPGESGTGGCERAAAGRVGAPESRERRRRVGTGQDGGGPVSRMSISIGREPPGWALDRRKDAVKLGCMGRTGAELRSGSPVLLSRRGRGGPGAASARIPASDMMFSVRCGGSCCGPGFCSISPQVRSDPRPECGGLSAEDVSEHERMCWLSACVQGGLKDIPQRVHVASLPKEDSWAKNEKDQWSVQRLRIAQARATWPSLQVGWVISSAQSCKLACKCSFSEQMLMRKYFLGASKYYIFGFP
jgi:hypothetical protein